MYMYMYIWDLCLHQMRSFTESVSISNKIFRVSLYVHGYVLCMCLSFYVSSEEDVCFSVGEEGEESELLWRIVL